MLGYTTNSEAIKNGFTHNASYYGIPCYIGDLDAIGPVMECKISWLNWTIDVASYIEGFIHSVMYPDEDCYFAIKITSPLVPLS